MPGGEAEDVAGSYSADAERLAGELRPGKTLVIWGERLGRGPDGAAALDALRNCAHELKCGAEGGGVFSVPDGANARGIREVGCLPGRRPRLHARPTRAGPWTRSRTASPPASSTASSSSTPTRSATSPTAPAGPRP